MTRLDHSRKVYMNQEGFEPPTFGSGIRRAAVAPFGLPGLDGQLLCRLKF